MQRIGVALVFFLLAVIASTGASFFLWGQHLDGGNSNGNLQKIAELESRIAVLQAQLDSSATSRSDKSVSYDDFEFLVTRQDDIERRLKEFSLPGTSASQPSNPEAGPVANAPTELAVRKVLEDIEEEKRRKREEERQQWIEESRKEREEWLTNVYNERLGLLTKELSLTPAQETSIRQALEVRKEQVSKVYESWRVPEEERQRNGVPSWDDINQAYDNSIKQILNQEQYQMYKQKKLDDFNSRRGRGGRQQGRGNRGG